MSVPPELQPSLLAARQGDPEAFCKLIEAYESRLLGQTLGLCRDPA